MSAGTQRLAQRPTSGRGRETHWPVMQTLTVVATQSSGPQRVPSAAVATPQPLVGSHSGAWHGAVVVQIRATCAQPLGPQASTVQGSPSSQLRGMPRQTPLWQAPITQLDWQAVPSARGASTHVPASGAKVEVTQTSLGVHSSGGRPSPSTAIS